MTGGTSGTSALIAASISAAAAVGSAAIAASNRPKKAKEPTMPLYTPTPTEDTAMQKLEEEERLRQRKGRAATLLQGENAAPVATTQSGGKTVLGG